MGSRHDQVSTGLVTTGYEGRSSEQLIADLSTMDVSIVADVRLTPLSRKPGLSRRTLSEAVESAGMSYVHLPELGNPRDNREAFRAGDPSARSRYLDRIRSPAGADAV